MYVRATKAKRRAGPIRMLQTMGVILLVQYLRTNLQPMGMGLKNDSLDSIS
jgi:hypothetical protein